MDCKMNKCTYNQARYGRSSKIQDFSRVVGGDKAAKNNGTDEQVVRHVGKQQLVIAGDF